jgi:hypothetical protein
MTAMHATDADLARLWCRSWHPEAATMLTAPCGWAVWDGTTATFGRHHAAPPPHADAAAACPGFVQHWLQLREPTAAALAARGLAAVADWAAAGFALAGEVDLKARLTACEACPLWDPAARAGLGRCKHGACGCSKFKRWLASERCPAGKW